MKYTQEDYKESLETEYDAQMRAFDKLIATKAAVLKERGDVFVARFIKFDSEIAIFKVRVADKMPRKNSIGQLPYCLAIWEAIRIGVICRGLI